MLSDMQVRNAKPQDRDYKLADSGGLYLYVTTKGTKSWRLKYRIADKEKRLVLRRYPCMSLLHARAEGAECQAGSSQWTGFVI